MTDMRINAGDLVRVVNCAGSDDQGREFVVHSTETPIDNYPYDDNRPPLAYTVYETPGRAWSSRTLEVVRRAGEPGPWHENLLRRARALDEAAKEHEAAKEAYHQANEHLSKCAARRMTAIAEFDAVSSCSAIVAAARAKP